jgi:hypothetical protein
MLRAVCGDDLQRVRASREKSDIILELSAKLRPHRHRATDRELGVDGQTSADERQDTIFDECIQQRLW